MNRPLHLLEVGVRWPPETFVQRKLQLLAAAGVRVTVASRMPPGAPRSPIPGIELRPIHYWNASLPRKLLDVVVSATALLVRRPRRAIRLFRAVRGPLTPPGEGFWWRVHLLRQYATLARLDPDVVQYEWETAAVEHLPLTEVWDCPVLMSCRAGGETASTTLSAWESRLSKAFERAAAVHCVSQATAEEAAARGLDLRKAHVIRTSVDSDFFSPSQNGSRPDDEFRMAAVATLRWAKGFEYLVQALADLRGRGVPARLEIVGPDPAAELEERSDRERVIFTAADLSLDGTVAFATGVGQAEVREALRASHVLLHGGLAEGIPNVVIEAMACGIPVVVADSGGVREAVTDGVEGFVVPRRDPRAMADALERLWRDPELRERMGLEARERAVTDFGPDAQVVNFLGMYHEAVGS